MFDNMGLLKNPVYLQTLVKEIVDNVDLPVTVKTRIGWDSSSIQILDVARRLEDAGIQALTVHCRTRVMGHKGDADWSWIPKIKEAVKIPIIGCGGITNWRDAVEYLLAGSTALEVGTAIMTYDFEIFNEINDGISQYMVDNKFNDLKEIIGLAHKS